MDGALCHVFSVVAEMFLDNGGVHCLAGSGHCCHTVA